MCFIYVMKGVYLLNLQLQFCQYMLLFLSESHQLFEINLNVIYW